MPSSHRIWLMNFTLWLWCSISPKSKGRLIWNLILKITNFLWMDSKSFTFESFLSLWKQLKIVWIKLISSMYIFIHLYKATIGLSVSMSIRSSIFLFTKYIKLKFSSLRMLPSDSCGGLVSHLEHFPFCKLSVSQNVHFSKCPLLKMSISQNVLFSKCPFLKMSISQNVLFSKCPFLKMCFSQNIHFRNCPDTILMGGNLVGRS